MNEHRMEIVQYGETDDDDVVVRSLPASSFGQAERLERGANRNLNHTKYYTRIVQPAAQPQSKV